MGGKRYGRAQASQPKTPKKILRAQRNRAQELRTKQVFAELPPATVHMVRQG